MSASLRSPHKLLGRACVALGLGALVLSSTLIMGSSVMASIPEAVESGEPPLIFLDSLDTRSIVFDSVGQEIGVLHAEEERSLIDLDQIPDLVVETLLSIEDRSFYDHNGVDLRSGLRAIWADFTAGGIDQGGSTITQQLVKNSILSSEQSVERKVREATLALQLEKQMTKDEILERYLNTVYLGHGAYGLQAGAETYFNMDVDELGWPEAALLVALVRNPVGYDPIARPELAKERRDLVLRTLVSQGHITEEEERFFDLVAMPAEVYERNETLPAAGLVGNSYFVEEVKQQLLDMEELGVDEFERYDAVFRGGIQVETTFDVRAQLLAEDAVTGVPDTDGKYFTGIASIDPQSGAVRAVVGGPDFETSKFNYMTQGFRQPGSTFKAIVLLEALEQGYVPNDIISGTSPCQFEDPTAEDGVYKPENFGGSRGKYATITQQTLSSSNCAYLRLGQVVGLDNVAKLANDMGLSTRPTSYDLEADPTLGANNEVPLRGDVLSLPIGAKEVHPIDMVAAYGAIANDGVYHEPYFIERVLSAEGDVLYEHSDPGVRVVSPETARLATEVLEQNVTSGTGTRARLKSSVAAGKTGTSNDSADAWFVGFTPELVTGVWIGSPTGRVPVVFGGSSAQGGRYPATVWRLMNEPYHAPLDTDDFLEADATRKGKTIGYKDYSSGAKKSSRDPLG